MDSNNKAKLNNLFKELRKDGLVARQNFLCCGGCASSEIGSMAEKRGLPGGVYYHQQDADKLYGRDYFMQKPAEEVYLGYGALDEADIDSRQIGIMICVAASRVGLEVEWNGSSAQRVKVKLPGGIEA